MKNNHDITTLLDATRKGFSYVLPKYGRADVYQHGEKKALKFINLEACWKPFLIKSGSD